MYGLLNLGFGMCSHFGGKKFVSIKNYKKDQLSKTAITMSILLTEIHKHIPVLHVGFHSFALIPWTILISKTGAGTNSVPDVTFQCACSIHADIRTYASTKLSVLLLVTIHDARDSYCSEHQDSTAHVC